MNREENRVNFDLSVLKLDELIKVYEEIENFIKLLRDKKIIEEEKEKGV